MRFVSAATRKRTAADAPSASAMRRDLHRDVRRAARAHRRERRARARRPRGSCASAVDAPAREGWPTVPTIAAAWAAERAVDRGADQVRRRGLSVGARDADDVEREGRVPVDGRRGVGAERVGDVVDDERAGTRRDASTPAPRAASTAAAPRATASATKRAPSDVRALARDEEIPGLDGARVVLHARTRTDGVAHDVASRIGSSRASSSSRRPVRARHVAPRTRHDAGSKTSAHGAPFGAGVPRAGACRTSRPEPSIWGTSPAVAERAPRRRAPAARRVGDPHARPAARSRRPGRRRRRRRRAGLASSRASRRPGRRRASRPAILADAGACGVTPR